MGRDLQETSSNLGHNRLVTALVGLEPADLQHQCFTVPNRIPHSAEFRADVPDLVEV